jgi:PAS domain S-box-containing protein
VTLHRSSNVRRKREPLLHRSQEMMRLVLDTIPQCVFWKGRHSAYLGCNVAFASAMGLRPEDVVGRTDAELPAILREEAEECRQADRRVMERNHHEYHMLEQIHRPSGGAFCLQPLVIHDLGLTIRQVLGRCMAHKGVV